ncbi:methyltransferase type 11 [Hahella sp. CCB-MM4]|uniref:class I SAM-dependent methyltransferase n=1 Tax=Hahella sp. (strain CCB-MM4) TaxID=1926491 RepID=UPI000B9BAFD6|nr:methyltransferase domain-containing protein [Hahella sp. CCB-MM4]OZG75243.1 methyltransferase type 11 [Hahella sp. CCB-MM4]
MNATFSGPPAEIYDRHFVPALFGQWGRVMVREAGISPGNLVLDVACGTGALTCHAADSTGGGHLVTGLDINEDMLAVARDKKPTIDWRQGSAEELPFQDESFDVVVSQFGFMFFENQVTALKEMMRVLKPGGRLAVAVCDALDHSPGYAVLAELLSRLFGEDIAQSFRAPFSCGDRSLLLERAESAGIHVSRYPDLNVARHDGKVRFPSVQALVSTERACVWTLGGLLDSEQFERLAEEAEESFQPFLVADGQVEFNMPVLILSTTKS